MNEIHGAVSVAVNSGTVFSQSKSPSSGTSAGGKRIAEYPVTEPRRCCCKRSTHPSCLTLIPVGCPRIDCPARQLLLPAPASMQSCVCDKLVYKFLLLRQIALQFCSGAEIFILNFSQSSLRVLLSVSLPGEIRLLYHSAWELHGGSGCVTNTVKTFSLTLLIWCQALYC